MDKVIIRSGSSMMEIDVLRFLFGDGKWVVTIHGENLFS